MTRRPSHRPFCLLACLGVLLAGCEPAPSPASLGTTPVTIGVDAGRVETFTLKRSASSCRSDCPQIAVSWLSLPLAGTLDKDVLAALGLVWQGGVTASFERVAADFLAGAEPRWTMDYVLTRQPGLRPDVLVLESTVSSYTGGAHGDADVRFHNVDTRSGKLLKLADVLLPGREAAFNHALAAVHAPWAQARQFGADSGWPFTPSDNIGLLPEALAVRYNAYAIGPYSEGAPLLQVPYATLRGILKPDYLPAP